MSLFTAKESKIEAEFVRRALAEHHVFAYKITGIRGFPDRLMILPPDGRVMLMEFKALAGRERKHQEIFRRRVALLGVTVHMPRSVEEAMRTLKGEMHGR